MKNYHFILIIIGFLLASCNMEEIKWKKTVKKNTSAAYIAFREKYPYSKYDSIAFEEIIDSYAKAIKLGDNERIQSIINYDPSLVKVEKKLISAIMLSADNCQLEVLKLFEKYISDINLYNTDGTTLLHHASKNGCIDIVNYLITNGADVNKMVGEDTNLRGFSVGSGSSLNPFGFGKVNNKPDLYGSPLQWAAKFNQLEIAKLLIDNGADVNKVTNRECSIFSHACESGNTKLVELLLSNGAKYHFNGLNLTQPIHHASSEEIAKMLIEKGESIKSYSNNCGMPIHFAAGKGFNDAVEFYIKQGIDVNQKVSIYFSPFVGKQSVTPIWMAAFGGHVETVKLLEAKGGNINYVARSANFNGNLIHAAAIGGDSVVTKYLLTKNINIDKITDFDEDYMGIGRIHYEGMSALGLAVILDNFDVLKVLIDKGADINYRTPENRSVLDYAIIVSRNVNMVEFLLKKGAKRYKTNFEIEKINTSDEVIKILKQYEYKTDSL